MRISATLVLFIFLLSQGEAVSAQSGNLRSNLAFGIGIPTHPDMDINENELYLSLAYRHNFNIVLNWGIFLLRSSASSELDFFGNKTSMLEYLNSPSSPGGIGTSWSRIETYALGAQLHLCLLNRPRHFLSFSGGIGFYTSLSSNQRIVEVTEEFIFTSDGEFLSSSIIDAEGEIHSERKTELFFMPALTYQYFLKGNFFVGTEVNVLLDLDTQELTRHPVLANFYSFNVVLGRRF